jgi:hypothetical protein
MAQGGVSLNARKTCTERLLAADRLVEARVAKVRALATHGGWGRRSPRVLEAQARQYGGHPSASNPAERITPCHAAT